jgi:hypothetical protein
MTDAADQKDEDAEAEISSSFKSHQYRSTFVYYPKQKEQKYAKNLQKSDEIFIEPPSYFTVMNEPKLRTSSLVISS